MIRHGSRARGLWLCLLIFAAGAPAVARAQDPSMDEIIARLRTWRESFANIRMVYERRNPGQILVRFPQLKGSPSLDQYFMVREYYKTDVGWYRSSWTTYENGVAVSKLLQGDHGDAYYISQYHTPSSVSTNVPTEVSVGSSRIHNGDRSEFGEPADPLYGIWLGRYWLDEWLVKLEPTLVRFDTLDGHRCALVRRTKVTNETLWLDLDHDCLPRLVEPDTPITTTWHKVDGFRQMSNSHWFPDHGSYKHRNDPPEEAYYWQVTEVEINRRSPKSEFAPPPKGSAKAYRDSRSPVPSSVSDQQAKSQSYLIWLWCGVGAATAIALAISVRLRRKPTA